MSGAKSFDDNLIKEKKARFLAVVERTAKALGSIVPETQFHEDKCPYDGGNEWAHIHYEIGIICVSIKRLREMSFEQIEETASHEVTHLIHPDHSHNFHNTHQEVKIATWKPPGGGTIHIRPGKDIKLKRRKPEDDDTEKCFYHACRKRATLTECSYCGEWFCDEHKKPGKAGVQNFNTIGIDDFDENTHPCIPYQINLENEKKASKKKYQEAVHQLSGGIPKTWKYDKKQVIDLDDNYEYSGEFDDIIHQNLRTKKEKKLDIKKNKKQLKREKRINNKEKKLDSQREHEKIVKKNSFVEDGNTLTVQIKEGFFGKLKGAFVEVSVGNVKLKNSMSGEKGMCKFENLAPLLYQVEIHRNETGSIYVPINMEKGNRKIIIKYNKKGEAKTIIK